jgi:hypothetical protein
MFLVVRGGIESPTQGFSITGSGACDCTLSGFAERAECFAIRARKQFDKISRGKTIDVSDGYPMKSTHLSGRLYARHACQFQEAIGRDSDAEAPLLRLAGLEISEVFFVNRVGEHVAWRTMKSFACASESSTQQLQFFNGHGEQCYLWRLNIAKFVA